MTRGTLTYIGPKSREIDLLLTRLEKEGYEIKKTTATTAVQQIKKHKPLAILASESCSKPQVIAWANIRIGKTSPPVILVSHDPVDIESTPQIGEVWPLHSISLAECVKRLKFALQLTQLKL